MSTCEIERITNGATELGVKLSREQASALKRYLDILEETNRSFNLTRIPRADYVTLHILDSLSALEAFPPQRDLKILDIGTGAGFPGVPLATALPEASVTLLDSTLKKIRFVGETASQCGITNCEVIHARAEVLAKDPKHKRRYDIVISRAVASFATLIELMEPFIKPKGQIIALKGAKVKEELRGTSELLSKLRLSEPRILPVRIPGIDAERYLIIVKRL